MSLRIFAFFLGLVLLFPGGCSISYMAVIIPGEFKSTYHDPYLPIAEWVWAFCLLVSFGGILLLRYALRVERDERPRSGDPPAKPE